MNARLAVSIAALLIGLFPCGPSITAGAQTQLRIRGALSNFDCWNDSTEDCDGFEIEIECEPEDVYHTYNYSAFGAPAVTGIGVPGAPRTLVRYKRPGSIVPPGGMTHFGVCLRRIVEPGRIQRRWLPAAPKPPKRVVLPHHHSMLVIMGDKTYVRDVISNTEPDGGIIFWVLPYLNVVHREVALEELLRDDPLITGSIPLGGGPNGLFPERLDPGDHWFDDDGDGEIALESVTYSYEVFADVVTYPGGIETHSPGAMIAKIMDATVAEPDAPLAPQFTIAPLSLTGGAAATGTVTINVLAAGPGAFVTLSSNDPAVKVPPTATILPETTSISFPIATKPVGTSTVVTVTATVGGATASVNMTVLPPVVTSLAFDVASVVGGNAAGGTVRLNGPAPFGGMLVELASSAAFVAPPATVTVPHGKTQKSFTLETTAVATESVATVSAAAGGATAQANLTVKPVSLKSVKLSPSTVHGGASATGTVRLNAPAGPGDLTVSLASSKPGIASVPATVTIPQGQSAVTFPIATTAVAAQKLAKITATYGAVSKSATLTVTP